MFPTLPLTACGGGSLGSWSSSLRASKHSFTKMCSGCSLATESRRRPHDDEHGEIRSSVLRQVKPCDSYYNPGRPFFAEIARRGPFRHVPELLSTSAFDLQPLASFLYRLDRRGGHGKG
jgi:hypothetical protein